MSSMWESTPRFSLPRNIQRPTYRLVDTQTDQSVHSCTYPTPLNTPLKNSMLCTDLLGSHRLSSQSLAKERWDPTHPTLDHRKKCFQPQSWLQKYSFCRKQNVSSLGIFFFFVLLLLLSRKGKCLSKRPSKHLRKPKPGSSAGEDNRRWVSSSLGEAQALGSSGPILTRAILHLFMVWSYFTVAPFTK